MYILYHTFKFLITIILEDYWVYDSHSFAVDFIKFKADNQFVLEKTLELSYENDLNLSIITSRSIAGSPQIYPKDRIYFFLYKYYYFIPKN